jgi:hypothetical protein
LFQDLVMKVLGSSVTTDVKRRLIAELEGLGKEFVSTQVADAVGRVIVKGVDGVAKAAVRSLDTEELAAGLAAAYLVEIQEQLHQFSDALDDYLPYAIAVEVAKRQYGSSSQQANGARAVRKRWMDEAKSEVRDIFKAVAGVEVAD